MAEVAVARFIAKFAFGFISDKLRDYATKKLQDGGHTDEKFKGYIIRELSEINSKLDGISRRELSASVSALQQGVRRLLDKNDTAWASSSDTWPAQVSERVDDAVALGIAIGRLKNKPDHLFEEARGCFKQAGIDGRRAFFNTALSLGERVLASKVRMASTMLEHLDNPDVAVTDCLLFLEELHAMPAIQEIFSVHFKGGIKALFKKDSRRETINAVTMMNLNLSDFITKFAGQIIAFFHWPMVYCDKLVVHPIYYNEDCFNKMKKMEVGLPWEFYLLQKMLERIVKLRGAITWNDRIKSTLCCVPYRNNIQRGLLKLQMPDANDMRSLCLSPVDLHSSAHCVAVDEHDYVYVLKVSLRSRLLGLHKILEFSAQVYDGDGVCVKDICLNVPFYLRFELEEVQQPLFYLGKDEGGLIFCAVNESSVFSNMVLFRKLVSLHDDVDGKLLEASTRIDSCCHEYILEFQNKTVSIPKDHFFAVPQFPFSTVTEIAFVHTQGNQLKGSVQLYPNCTNSPSSSSLWARYLPIIHVTTDGETSRCLHSRENLMALFSRGF